MSRSSAPAGARGRRRRPRLAKPTPPSAACWATSQAGTRRSTSMAPRCRLAAGPLTGAPAQGDDGEREGGHHGPTGRGLSRARGGSALIAAQDQAGRAYSRVIRPAASLENASASPCRPVPLDHASWRPVTRRPDAAATRPPRKCPASSLMAGLTSGAEPRPFRAAPPRRAASDPIVTQSTTGPPFARRHRRLDAREQPACRQPHEAEQEPCRPSRPTATGATDAGEVEMFRLVLARVTPRCRRRGHLQPAIRPGGRSKRPFRGLRGSSAAATALRFTRARCAEEPSHVATETMQSCDRHAGRQAAPEARLLEGCRNRPCDGPGTSGGDWGRSPAVPADGRLASATRRQGRPRRSSVGGRAARCRR